jgi:hypothetical protein
VNCLCAAFRLKVLKTLFLTSRDILLKGVPQTLNEKLMNSFFIIANLREFLNQIS